MNALSRVLSVLAILTAVALGVEFLYLAVRARRVMKAYRILAGDIGRGLAQVSGLSAMIRVEALLRAEHHKAQGDWCMGVPFWSCRSIR